MQWYSHTEELAICLKCTAHADILNMDSYGSVCKGQATESINALPN